MTLPAMPAKLTPPQVAAAYQIPAGDGAVPTSDGFDAEVSLDLAVLGSLTPRADIRIYYTPSRVSEEYLAAVTQAVAECDVVSSSWVNTDDNVLAMIARAFENVLLQARARGVVFQRRRRLGVRWQVGDAQRDGGPVGGVPC